MKDQKGTQTPSRLSKIDPRNLLGIIAAFAARTSTAGTGYVESIMIAHMDTFVLAGTESLFGGILLLIILPLGKLHFFERLLVRLRGSQDVERSSGQLPNPDRLVKFAIVVIGLTILAIFTKQMALMALKAGFSSGSLGACLAVGPLTLSVYQGFRDGRPGRAFGAALIAFAGVALVTGFVSLSGLNLPLGGALFALLAAGSRGLAIPLSRRPIDRSQGNLANTCSTLASAIVLLIWARFISHSDLSPLGDATTCLAIFGVSVISTVIPQLADLLARILILDKDRTYAIIYSSGPMISVLISVAGHQALTWMQFLGIVSLSIAVLISQLGRKTQAR
jgi:drug/metabolite transporter (DMT)-like permease